MRKLTKMLAVIVCFVFLLTSMGQTILAAENTTKVIHQTEVKKTGVKSWLTKVIVKALSKTLRSSALRVKLVKWVEVEISADVAIAIGKYAPTIADALDDISGYADWARVELAMHISGVLITAGMYSSLANKVGWGIVWIIEWYVF